MRDSVPSGSYSSVCNVLRQWKSRSSLLIESTDSMIESTDSMISMLMQVSCFFCMHRKKQSRLYISFHVHKNVVRL